MHDDKTVKCQLMGAVGVVTLDRQKALNSLSLGMIRQIADQLEAWQKDPRVAAILLRGEGDRAFCAGADVRALYDAGPGDAGLTRDFFWHEYRLDRLIHGFEKPIVAHWHGISMGGGLGLSATAPFRVCTPKTRAAMPESGIGLFPDAGGTYFLGNLKGQIGLYLGMTGVHLSPADALAVGLGTHHLKPEGWSTFESELFAAEAADLSAEAIGKRLDDMHSDPGPSEMAPLFSQIETLFSATSLKGILEGLRQSPSAFAKETLALLETRSPTSVAYAFEAHHRSRGQSFDDIMVMEFRLSQACMRGHDFFEGIRALLVDKDKSPKWKPASFAELSQMEINAAFDTPAGGDLHFD
jgi:enoyl-CoA hydratase